MLNLGASALGAHLDPAYRTERLPMIRLHKNALAAAGFVIAGLIVLVLLAGIVVWQDNLGNDGPPPPLSQSGAFGVAFSPDGRTVATINTNLEIWNAADLARPERLGYSRGDTVSGTDPAFTPGGRVLATAGGKTVILWNVAHHPGRPAQITVLPAGPAGVGAVAFSPDGRTLASGYDDGTVALWNAADPARVARIATLTRQAGGIAALSFSPGGHLLASASNNGAVALWNVAGPAQPALTATLRLTVPAPAAQQGGFPDVALAFSADGHTLTTIAGNSTVTRWNVTGPGTVTRITTITGHSIGSGPVAFSPGGRAVAGAPVTGDTVALWTLP